MNPAQVVEAVLFASDAPLRTEEIARADEALNEDLIEDAIGELNAAYSESERAFEIRELGEGYQLLTRPSSLPTSSASTPSRDPPGSPARRSRPWPSSPIASPWVASRSNTFGESARRG